METAIDSAHRDLPLLQSRLRRAVVAARHVPGTTATQPQVPGTTATQPHGGPSLTHRALPPQLEALEDDHEGIEANFSDGVLSVAVAGHGTWVVNKQAPSRQLWWSSPLSGPLRFDLVSNDDPEARVWHNGRRDVELNALLRTEMDATLGVEVEVPEDAS